MLHSLFGVQLQRSHIAKYDALEIVDSKEHLFLFALRYILPNEPWQPWRFEFLSQWWQDTENQLEYLQYVASCLSMKCPEDWYEVKSETIVSLHGSKLLDIHGSLCKILMTVVPSYTWQPWRFETVTRSFWDSLEQQRNFMDWLSKKINIVRMEDWYERSSIDIISRGGSTLLAKYGCMSSLLARVFPEISWKPWLFKTVPSGFWELEENLRLFLDHIAMELNIKQPYQWYNVTRNDMLKYGGSSLLEYYGSLGSVLKAVYPDYLWQEWRFESVCRGFWMDNNNCKKYLSWLAEQMNVDTPTKWYGIKSEHFVQHHGSSLLQKYGSVSQILQTIYPNFPWIPWRFASASVGLWRDQANAREYLTWLSSKHGMEGPDDWNFVTWNLLLSNRGRTLLLRHGGMLSLLSQTFPLYNWHLNKWTGPNIKKSQELLYRAIKAVLGDRLVKADFQHPFLRYQRSNRPMQFDVWVEDFALGFEYHGKQHYQSQEYYGDYHLHLRDAEKTKACAEAGITLIHVPYWWNYSTSALDATIRQVLWFRTH